MEGSEFQVGQPAFPALCAREGSRSQGSSVHHVTGAAASLSRNAAFWYTKTLSHPEALLELLPLGNEAETLPEAEDLIPCHPDQDVPVIS